MRAKVFEDWVEAKRYLYLIEDTIHGPLAHRMVTMETVKHKEGFSYTPEEALLVEKLDRPDGQHFQSILDALWEHGFRPTSPMSSEKLAVELQDEHLKHVTRLLDTILPSALRKP